MRLSLLAGAVLACGLTVSASAQQTLDWPTGQLLPYEIDSGLQPNPAPAAATVFVEPVKVESAVWLRLYFGPVQLEDGSFLRITSLRDGEVQELDAAALAAWGGTSAYFNGDTVTVELVAAPGSTDNRVVVEQIAMHAQPLGGPGQCGICGSDDRVPSSEEWSSRLLPAGCTASVWNESSCMVSAGHCIGGSMVVQFNVPSSNGNCSINNPPVADQFPILDSAQVNGGIGNDWSVLIPGTNNVGELPFERYGVLRPIAMSPASLNDPIQIYGYGVDQTCTLSQTQQLSEGVISAVSGTFYEFTADVRGGNSGSAIIKDDEIIGIVTHCSGGGCPNFGTRVDLASFADARDDLCGDNILFAFPNGLPDVVDPDGGTTVDVVVSADSAEPAPGTGLVHISVDGGPFNATAMSEGPPNNYTATFPATSCGSIVRYYFSAETTTGETIVSPKEAPDASNPAVSAVSVTTVFDDDFQSDQGWTVTSAGGLTDGQWQRGIPIPNSICNRGNPGNDGDGSGQCYVTDNSSANGCNSDVDNGFTILTSPVMDASAGDAYVTYWRWFSNVAGDSPNQDVFEVEVSGDGGGLWVSLEDVGPAGAESDGGWFRRMFSLDDVGVATSQFRIRFIASDTDPQSVVEAGADGVILRTITCDGVEPCPWDLDGDGNVGVNDLIDLLANWGDPYDVNDLIALLGDWGPCP